MVTHLDLSYILSTILYMCLLFTVTIICPSYRTDVPLFSSFSSDFQSSSHLFSSTSHHTTPHHTTPHHTNPPIIKTMTMCIWWTTLRTTFGHGSGHTSTPLNLCSSPALPTPSIYVSFWLLLLMYCFIIDIARLFVPEEVPTMVTASYNRVVANSGVCYLLSIIS